MELKLLERDMKNIIFTFFTSILAIFSLSGCTAKLADPEINFAPPTYVEQMPSREEQQDFVSTGSLFGQGDNPLFSDHKAMHVNDIVTVVISETAKSSNTGAKQLTSSETNALAAGLAGFAFSKIGAKNLPLPMTPGYSNSYKGQGSATKNASFTTTISARVVKILKNGNYFISGRREILVDDQKQLIQISGVIRPYDIDQNNNVNSSQMSDAKILYKTEGDVNRATQQGWGTKLIEAVWPF